MLHHLRKQKLYNFSVPRIETGLVLAKAVVAHERASGKKIDMTLLRIAEQNHLILNYIRHRMINDYNNNCWSKEFEKDETLYFDWFKAINNEIKFKYPFLETAVGQQIAAKRQRIFGDRSSAPPEKQRNMGYRKVEHGKVK